MLLLNKKFLIFILFLCSYIVGCQKNLTPNEITEIKEGKTFWKWDSPHGVFDIHYIEKGSGSKHVLLIHGFGANTYTWRYIIDDLAKAGYHVWTLDLLGFGLSDKPLGVPYGLNLFLEQINSFMDVKGINKAHIIGNSMGGGLSLGMAITYPQKIISLTLIDALGYPLDLPFPLKISKALGEAIKHFQGKFLVRRMLEDIVYDPKTITDEQVEAYTIPLQMPGGSEAYSATLESLENKQLIELGQNFKKIQIPVLLIWGAEDKWIPLNNFENFSRDFPKAQKVILKQCGHIPQEECPQESSAAIIHFLSEIR
ncbi:MAG: alpha/beta hydrolase [Parachlamydiaceae bacterium]|nr:alpha/beta hydrolase [Parachlamydiaceae bacterium]